MKRESNHIRHLKGKLKYSFIGNTGSAFISIITTIILARMMSPIEFGILAVVIVITAFSSVFFEGGLGPALLLEHKNDPKYIDTIFWVSIILGIILAILFISFANKISIYFGGKELEKYIYASAIIILLQSYMVIPYFILLKREMQKLIAFADIAIIIVTSLLSIFLAYNGLGVWSIIIGTVITLFSKSILFTIHSVWLPSNFINKDYFKMVMKYSSRVFSANILRYLNTHIDLIIIGNKYNTATLGLYRTANRLLIFPSIVIGSIFNRVLLPYYSTNANQKSVINIQLTIMKYVAFFSFPFFLIVSSLSNPMVIILLGQRWQEMGLTVQLLSLSFIFQPLSTLNYSLYLAKHAHIENNIMSVFGLATNICAIIIGMKYGYIYILWALLISRYINALTGFYMLKRILGITLLDIGRSIYKIFLSALFVMVLNLYLINQIGLKIVSVFDLLISILLSIIIYLSVLYILDRKLLQSFSIFKLSR